MMLVVIMEEDAYGNCELPDYNWTSNNGYSNIEIASFEQLIRDNFNTMYLVKLK